MVTQRAITMGIAEHAEVIATEATASFGSCTVVGTVAVKWEERSWPSMDPEATLIKKLDSLKGEKTVSFATTSEALTYLRSLAHQRS